MSKATFPMYEPGSSPPPKVTIDTESIWQTQQVGTKVGPSQIVYDRTAIYVIHQSQPIVVMVPQATVDAEW